MDPTEHSGHSFLTGLPRPVWIAAATTVLFAGATALGIGVPSWRQHTAIREVSQAGGHVETAQGGPRWLRDQLGDANMRVFDEVITVDLGTTDASDATLHQVGSLTRVKELSLYATKVTDAGLEQLKGLRSLERLVLQDTGITDGGLVHLQKLPRLDTLSLRGTKVTDQGLARLVG